MLTFLFFYLAGVTVISSLLVISLRNIVYSVLALLVAFIHIAGLYLLLNAEFIAAIQIVVYAGAILIFYLFGVMFFSTNLKAKVIHHQYPIAIIIGLFILGEFIVAIYSSTFSVNRGEYTVQKIAEAGNTETIGMLLYGVYLLPVEIASLILLVAMIGAIILAKRELVS
ncbi:MAG TPA: NADH-quinone oxidoreductase subunit J [Nitrospiria bacterium]|nr:NADH-quinone oxidoreductase subunit J [Nitrospiria bacterium]